MKKSFFLLPAILIAIFVFFSLIDRSDYVLEKKMWKIHQLYAVQAKYGILSKEQAENLAGMYQGLIEKYPKSPLLAQMYMQIGQVYATSKDFEKARTNYSQVLHQMGQWEGLYATALMNIGLIYEKEKNDAEAIKTYQQIVKDYPLTDVGFNMPFYIVGYYHRLNKDVQMDNELQEAEGFYQKVAGENPDSLKGFYALRLLAATYLLEKKWNIALKILEKIFLGYSHSPYMDWKAAGMMVYSITDIAVNKLQEPNQAILFYQMFIEKHPDSPLNKFLKKVIISLQDFKSVKKLPAAQKT